MPPLPPPSRVKLVVNVPASHVEATVEALHEAGAGRVGSYDHVVSTVPVTGRWRPLPGARPWAGTIGVVGSADEVRLETRCPVGHLDAALAAIRAVHPYEEPTIDVVPLLDVAAAEPDAATDAGRTTTRLWPPGTACTLVTLGADGAPHAVPVSAAQARPEDPGRVVFALALRRGSLARLRADRRAALAVLAADLALTLRGDVRVLEEAPAEAPRVALLELRVTARDDHRHPDTLLEAPVAWRWRSDEAAARDDAVHRAVARLLDRP